MKNRKNSKRNQFLLCVRLVGILWLAGCGPRSAWLAGHHALLAMLSFRVCCLPSPNPCSAGSSLVWCRSDWSCTGLAAPILSDGRGWAWLNPGRPVAPLSSWIDLGWARLNPGRPVVPLVTLRTWVYQKSMKDGQYLENEVCIFVVVEFLLQSQG